MQLIEFDTQAVFADCNAILLMSRWHAIPLSKYFSIDVNIISKYSLTVTPLVVNAHNKKGHFPAFATEKCPIHITDICVAYLLLMCCIPFEIQHI